MTYSQRLAAYGTTSTALALISDRDLADRLATAPVVNSGIGGTAVRLTVDGTPVFAKQVAAGGASWPRT